VAEQHKRSKIQPLTRTQILVTMVLPAVVLWLIAKLCCKFLPVTLKWTAMALPLGLGLGLTITAAVRWSIALACLPP